jgi:hypothetical protein
MTGLFIVNLLSRSGSRRGANHNEGPWVRQVSAAEANPTDPAPIIYLKSLPSGLSNFRQKHVFERQSQHDPCGVI